MRPQAVIRPTTLHPAKDAQSLLMRNMLEELRPLLRR